MDVEERIFTKLDNIEAKINDLCMKYTQLKTEHEGHIQDMTDNQNRKLRNRDYIIVMFGTTIAFVEVLRSLGVI